MTIPILFLALTAKAHLDVDAPFGFRKAEEQEVFNMRAEDDGPDYMLSFVENRLRIESRVAWVQREQAEAKHSTLVKDAKFKIVLPSGKLYWKPGMGTQVEDGWLKGYNGGEFGGGLFWFAADASGYKKLSDRNTQIVINTPKGAFAVQAHTHMMFWYSDLVEVRKGSSQWETRLVTNLHVAPADIVRDGDRFIYVTDSYVSTLNTDGTQREIYRFGWGELRVESMARRPNGEIWVGTSYHLLRLTPKGADQYAAQWYASKSLKVK